MEVRLQLGWMKRPALETRSVTQFCDFGRTIALPQNIRASALKIGSSHIGLISLTQPFQTFHPHIVDQILPHPGIRQRAECHCLPGEVLSSGKELCPPFALAFAFTSEVVFVTMPARDGKA